MSDDFCLVHGREAMRHDRGPIAYCLRCEPPYKIAEEVVDNIRDYTYRRGQDAGWHFNMDRDEAITYVLAAMVEATK